MTAPTINSKIDTASSAFAANAAHNRALAEKRRADVATAALGGSEASRERHVWRGKLLPRDRVERLLDPGSPLLDIGAGTNEIRRMLIGRELIGAEA